MRCPKIRTSLALCIIVLSKDMICTLRIQQTFDVGQTQQLTKTMDFDFLCFRANMYGVNRS